MVALRSSVATLLSLLIFPVIFPVVLPVVLGACDVGEVPAAGGGGTPDAGAGNTVQAMKFTSVLKPVVARCAIAGCHLADPGKPVQVPNFFSYDTLGPQYKTGTGSQNILVTHVADGQLHNNIAYLSTAEKSTVAGWIDGK
jgi:hypothetical protein